MPDQASTRSALARRCDAALRIIGVAALLASPAGVDAQIAPERPAYEPSRLIIKVADDVDVGLDDVTRRGRSLAAAMPGTGLDALNQRFGARNVRPLRLADRNGVAVAQRRAAENARRARSQRRGAAGPTSGRSSTIPSFASTYVVDLAPGVDVREAAAAYAADPVVEWAQPDWLRRATALTNDPFAASAGAWGQPFADLWGVHLTSAPIAWDTARGAGVVIAVSDNGLDTTHPDLAANVWVNPGEIAANGIDDDGNGYVDDVNGWNFVADSNVVADDNGHGKHVAGTAAGVGNNGVGIVGIAYEATVMAVKGLSAAGVGADSALADGLLYALENGADVINAS